jgi:hypothetical protein
VLRPLDELAAELAAEHQRCEGAYRQALEHALRCGDLLIEAKAQLAHGEWRGWVAANFPGSDRTARAYMQLARNRHQLERRPVANSGIRAALRELAAPRKEPRPTVEETLTAAGPFEGAMDELDAAPEPEPPSWAGYRRTGVWRRTMKSVRQSVNKADRKLGAAREGRSLFPELVADLLCEAAAALEEAAHDLRALADYVLEGRR